MYLPGCPSQGLTITLKRRSRHTSYPRHAGIITNAFSQQQQQQHQPQPEQPVPVQPPTKQQTCDDPRLKWARPEWVKPAAQPPKVNSLPSPAAAAAGLTPGSSIQLSAAALQRRQRLLNKVTYGSFNSSGNGSEDAADGSSSRQQHQHLFQAMGVDFGAHRVGIAVRRSSHNVPLLTLHRQQDTGSSDGSSSSSKSQGQQQHQPHRGPGHSQSSRSTSRSKCVLPLRRTAAVVLHLALQEGCDGFVIGLPVYTDFAEPVAAAAAAAVMKRGNSRSISRPGAAAAAAAAAGDGSWINSVIRGFAQTLADLAAPLELPVLLVNEQESSQQARAVMAGAAAYDVKSQAELDAELAAAASVEQQWQPQQQMTKQQRHELQKQQHAIGRDAFAAALILSRYYNGLVEPVEQLQGGSPTTSSSSSNTSSSGSSPQGGWASTKVQQQAAADLKWMLLSPQEQRRRREQRERMKAAAEAAAVGAEVPAPAVAAHEQQPAAEQALDSGTATSPTGSTASTSNAS